MWGKIVFAVTCIDGRVSVAIERIALRLINMQCNHADGAHTTCARQIDALSTTSNRVRGRERIVIGHRPDGLGASRTHDFVGQIERPARLTTRRVNIKQHRIHIGIVDRCIDLRADGGVARQTRCRVHGSRASHQGSKHTDHRDIGRLKVCAHHALGW